MKVNFYLHLPVNDANMPMPEPIAPEEESKILAVVKNDTMVSSILSKGDWRVAFVSPFYDDEVKVGGAAHIIFEKLIWFEGTYNNPPAKKEHSVKMWLGALDVFVDLSKNSVTGIDPGVGNPEGDPPQSVKNIQARNVAHAKAASELKRNDLIVNLLAIYHTPEHPNGLAYYMIDSSDGSKISIGVDLSNNQIVDKCTTKVIKRTK